MRALLVAVVVAVGSAAAVAGDGASATPGRQAASTAASAASTGVVAARRSGPAASAAEPSAPVRYGLPVRGRVVRAFDPPATEYGAGHLGVDLSAAAGTPVLAAADGAVTFAGAVAGRRLVVIRHADGVRTEYEPVTVAVRSGQPVARGQPIGQVSGRHAGCAASCLHWGARRADTYIDPLSLLRPLGPVRLLPWPRGSSG